MNTIPTKINRYNVYNKGNRLLGVGEEMTLPDFEPSSETVTGAGILGEIDDPTVGYFGNQELEIPFRLLDKETADMMDMTKAVQLEIRGAQQTTNTEGDIQTHARGGSWPRRKADHRQGQGRQPHGHRDHADHSLHSH